MDSGSASRGDRWWRVELCADVCVCTMRVCAQMRVCARYVCVRGCVCVRG